MPAQESNLFLHTSFQMGFSAQLPAVDADIRIPSARTKSIRVSGEANGDTFTTLTRNNATTSPADPNTYSIGNSRANASKP